MIKFLDLHKINARFEDALKTSFQSFLDSGYYVLGNQTTNFEADYAKYCGVGFCVGVSTGLDAIRLIFEAYKVLGKLQDGDEVIVPANTYIASILAISQSGLKPVLVEPNEATFNLCPYNTIKAITAKTKAILAVHLYGQLCDMESLKDIAVTRDLLVIEDAAQAHGAIDKAGNMAGNLANAAAFSFYPTKNLGALGEAGAITTNDKMLFEILLKLRNYGTSQRYVSDIKGYNNRIDELQTAILAVKLPYLQKDNDRRREIAKTYLNYITNTKIQLPFFSYKEDHVFHLFVIRCKQRDALQQYLEKHGVQTIIHYPIPPHKQQAYTVFKTLNLPITETIHNEVLSLPISPVMSNDEVNEVISVINKF